MTIKPTLLVLAAGMGSRYGGLKQLDSVGPDGETIIDYSIFDAIRAGFGKVVFVIRRDIEDAFKEQVGARYQDRITVAYAFQELDALPEGFTVPAGREKPWGTGQAILCAAGVVNEPCAVINGDDFYGAAAFQTAADYLSQAKDEENGCADWSMVGFVLRNTLSDFGAVSRGVCSCDADNKLQDVNECIGITADPDPTKSGASYPDSNQVAQPLTGDELVSMNMWGFTPSIFKHIETQFIDFLNTQGTELKSEFYIPTVVNTCLNNQTAAVTVLRSESSWFGVTYREDKPFVQKSIQAFVDDGIYPAPLW